MATLFDFFLRRPRPGLPVPPVPGEVIGERLVEEVDEALSTLNVPGELGEMLKKDLKGALDVKGEARPGYEPGAVAFAKFNLIDAITQPSKTAREMAASVFENRSRPPIPLLWTDAESAVWNKFFVDPTIGWIDPTTGNPVVPSSLRQATLRWNERARLRVTRVIAEERGIFENPGLTLMMAKQLNYYYASLPGAPAPIVAGVMLPSIIQEAKQAEMETTHTLALADAAEKVGDHAEGVKRWDEATKRQKQWAKDSKDYQDPVRKEFERVSRMGSQKNAPPAAYNLANSQEAKFWRYWKNRRLYFQTLNFLSTYRDKGLWRTARVYAWNWGVKKIFGLKPTADASGWTKLRYYAYPANAIGWITTKAAKKVRLTKLLTKLTDAKALFARTWKRFIKDPLTKGIELIRDKVVRKFIGWAAMKLGLAGLGATLGSVLPGVGTALGAVISAIASFLVETAISKMGGVWRVAFVGVVGGVSLVFAILMAGGLGFVVLVSLIFNTNAVLPAAVTAVPITVTKEACEPAPSCDDFDNPLQITKDGLIHRIRWRITIANTGDETETVGFSDKYCQPVGDPSALPFTIGPGEEKHFYCSQNITASNDEVITNTVKGATIPGNVSFSGAGAVIVGEPDTAYPVGWPLVSGCITQGPNAPYSHTGDEAIDINLYNAGNPVLATHGGVVVRYCYTVSGCIGGYGNYVQVRSSAGFETVYAHLASVYVTTGDPVFFGQPVGTVGNTGNAQGFHLHYEFFRLEMAPPYIPQEVPPCVGRGACNICW